MPGRRELCRARRQLLGATALPALTFVPTGTIVERKGVKRNAVDLRLNLLLNDFD